MNPSTDPPQMETLQGRRSFSEPGHEGFAPRGHPSDSEDQDPSSFPLIKPFQRGDVPYRLFGPKPKVTGLSSVFTLIHHAKKIVVLMGAGASVGPDFRSPGGLYDTIRQTGLLQDPYQVFDLPVFQADPSIFWRFAHLVFPAENPEFSSAHYFIEALEARGKLLRVYSQNVDTLERGIAPEHLRCVHGSWRQNHCCQCNQIYGIEDLRAAVNARTVPCCGRCGGPIKPGIVFFGQPTQLDEAEMHEDAKQADLLIVIGTSLKVQPISELPKVMRRVPSILINREAVGHRFDAEMLGDCSDVIESIQVALGWKDAETEVREPIWMNRNRFVFLRNSAVETAVVYAGRTNFLRTPTRRGPHDFE